MRFDTTTGSVTGAAHLHAARNGQDGVAVVRTGDVLVLVVTDGCGSAPHSEVGAKLGAKIVAEELARATAVDLGETANRIASRLDAVARLAGGDRRAFILDHLLFTIVAAVVTPEETFVLSAGDGVFAVNGDGRVIGPFPENAPPYLAYALLDGTPPTLTIERRIATAQLESVVIGSDGASQLAADLASFASDELLFRNPDALRRRLFRLARGRDATLDDDTTLAIARKIQVPAELAEDMRASEGMRGIA